MSEEPQRMKILHVDDESDFLALTKRYLEQDAIFSVDTASSSEEGLELVKSGAYDIVVSDYLMPVMDGLEFLRDLRQSGNMIPFIMFTGKGREEVAMEALNRGANGYLQKGVDIDSMFGTLAHMIKMEREKKRAEDALRESEENYRNLVERANDGITIVQDGIVKYANPRLLEIWGSSAEETVGTPFAGYVHPDELSKVVDHYKRRMAGEVVPQTYETILRRKDGTKLRVEVNAGVTTYQGKSADLVIVRDITPRKRAAEELQKLSQFRESIIENANVWLDVLDANANVVIWNKAAEEISGYSRDEVVGHGRIWEWLYPDEAYRKEITTKAAAIIENGAVVENFETTIRRKDGQTRIISWHSHNLTDERGTPIGSIALGRDFTDRKRMEEALRESERRYRLLAENVRDVIWTLDLKNLRFTYMSPSIKQLTGHSVEEAMSLTLEELLTPASYELAMKTLVEELTIERRAQKDLYRSRTLELGLNCKDGSTIWAEAKMNFLRDADGRPVGIMGVSRDITKRKAVEETLMKSEEEYRSLVESTEDSIYLVDRDCRYIFMNEKHLSRLGMPKDQIIGKTYGELHSEEEKKKFAEIVERVFENNKSVQHEHRSRRDNRYFLRTLSPVKDPEGRTMAVTVISKDVTERKKADEEREHLLKELAAKNREMGHFTYTVSHDLRSPLVTIQGFTSMLQKDVERNEREKVETDLRHIASAAAKMDTLLGDTLRLSRIGRVANPPEAVPFGAIVKDALGQTAGELKAANVAVSLAEDFPTVHVDRMRIAEVLVNLIGNSIKYRGNHPTIEIGHRQDGKETVFFVKDNGIGIDKSEQEKVFELFYKLDKSSEGTGAGLAIVKRIIEVHGGRIWIESELGKGTTVYFTLPVQ
jgi:PAS domain S-box-containing protein